MRLFVALEPSPAFRDALSRLQDRLRQAGITGRYLTPSNLHLTLAFIGEWPEDVTPVLPPVSRPFSIALSRPGIFPGARVLWAGVDECAPLNALARRVRECLTASGIPHDPQAFNPHITLLRKPVLPREDLLSSVEVPKASMTVREVCLYRSCRTEQGLTYSVIGRTGPAAP